MLKARAGDVFIFGLSEENLTRLRKGKSCCIDLRSMGAPGMKVVIYYGRDEAHLRQQIEELIGPETHVRGEEH